MHTVLIDTIAKVCEPGHQPAVIGRESASAVAHIVVQDDSFLRCRRQCTACFAERRGDAFDANLVFGHMRFVFWTYAFCFWDICVWFGFICAVTSI